MKLRSLAEAEADLKEAAQWYDDRQDGLGEQFIEEYIEAIQRILVAPLSYARLETTRSRRNLRRCFLKRFPYYIAYELFDHEVIVLAVAHARRRPNYRIRRT